LSSFIYRANIGLGADSEVALFSVQVFSAFISIATLYLAIEILVKMPFIQRYSAAVTFGALVIATLPALILVGARINNDPLAQFLSLVAFASLYSWWISSSCQSWYLGVLALSLAVLTKANSLTLVPVFFVCLISAKHSTLRAKVLLGSGATLTALVVLGWYLYFRIYFDDHNNLVGNIGNLNHALRLDNNIRYFYVLNPFKMIEYPFNNAWIDSSRRAYLWEYLVRSALFGEFDWGEAFKPYARLMVASVLLLGCIAAYGAVISLSTATIPIYILLIFHLLAVAAMRIFSPFSCHQDFRYILIAALPLAYFFSRGAVSFSRIWFWLSACGLAIFVILSCYLVITA
jgi:4-amino-4-deoxy-L-arabinose transferase-like glycosyltransferase